MKKNKKEEFNLYDFNAQEEAENKENKKNKKVKNKKNNKANKKVQSNKKNNKNDNKNKTINTENKFDFNNEIVIGIPKQENKTTKNGKSVTKKVNNKKKSKVKKQVSINNKKSQITKNKINTNILNKEKQLKVKKVKKKIEILKYTFLIISIITLIVAVMASPLFNIKEIIVEGNIKLSKDEIISLSQITLDENTYKISKTKVEKAILENAYVNNVEIKRILPSKVSIKIQERKTTYMIEYGSGYVYVNNQGYILDVAAEKLEVPIIQGAETIAEQFVPGNRLCTEDLEKMSTVIKIMEVAANNDISKLISRIDIENKQNYKILFESEQKVAHLGDGVDLNDKIPNIVSILDKEKGIAGEIFVNMDLKTSNPIFRQSV